MHRPLDIIEIADLQELFESKKWIDEINEFDESIFEKTVNLLELLEPKQRGLVLSFLKEYVRITNYDNYCRNIAKQIRERHTRTSKLLFLPVCDSEPKIKSGHSVCYEIQTFFDHSDFSEVNTIDHYDRISDAHTNHKIIIVDDFVGSGSQIRKMLRLIERSCPGISLRTEIYVICIQEVALTRVKKLCGNVFPCEIRKRAITDSAAIGNYTVEDAHRIYREIENRLSMRVWYRLGYGRTEALVSMKRTPNNTLPIFWNGKARGGKKWPAPFLRVTQ